MNEMIDQILNGLETPSVNIIVDNIEDPKVKNTIKNIMIAQKKEITSRIALAKKAATKTSTALETYKKQLNSSAEKVTELTKQVEGFSTYEPIITEHKNKIRAEKYKEFISPDMLNVAFKLADVSDEEDETSVKAKLTKLISDNPLIDFNKTKTDQVQKQFPPGTPPPLTTFSNPQVKDPTNNPDFSALPKNLLKVANSKTDSPELTDLVNSLLLNK